MQVFIETTSGLERRLTVGVPADRVESEVDNRLQKASKQVRLDGFRPGKVPMRVMRQRFGPGVRQEVVGEVMSQSFREAVAQEKLRPAGQPSIEAKSLAEGKDLEYIATFEVFPDIELIDLTGLEIERPQAEVADEDVDNMIDIFRKQQGNLEQVERAAEEGDTVNIDFKGLRDGEAFEGGSGEGTDLELGSGRMIPGFEDGIVGLEAGASKTLDLTFPEDYHSEDLKGAAVQFEITVNSVKSLKLAELDDELFAKYGVDEGGLEAFRSEISENMDRELRNAVKNRVKQQVMDAVVEAYPNLDVPKALIEQEVEGLRQQMFQQVGGGMQQQDLDLKSLLPNDMFEEQATRRVKLGLIMSEMVSQQEMNADPERVRETIEELASTYQDPEEVINYYYSNQEQLSSVESMVVEDQMVEKLLEGANVTEAPCSYQDAINAARQQIA